MADQIGSVQNLVQVIQAGQANQVALLTAMNASLAALVAGGGVMPVTAYVEGTWTPGLAFGGATTGITYGSQVGTYTRAGRLVVCQFHIVLTSKGSATGAATVTGLPVAAGSGAAASGGGGAVHNYSALTGLTGSPRLYGAAAASVMTLAQSGAVASADLTDASFTNTATINGSFEFFA